MMTVSRSDWYDQEPVDAEALLGAVLQDAGIACTVSRWLPGDDDDIDLDAEVVHLNGERITNERAEQMAGEAEKHAANLIARL